MSYNCQYFHLHEDKIGIISFHTQSDRYLRLFHKLIQDHIYFLYVYLLMINSYQNHEQHENNTKNRNIIYED